MSEIANRFAAGTADVDYRRSATRSEPKPSYPVWRTSSFCDFEKCVALADLDEYVAVHHPSDPRWPLITRADDILPLQGKVGIINTHDPYRVLIVGKSAAAAWIEGIKAGEFDDLFG